MGSDLGKRPSFAWRSIWNARPLLGEGLMWMVGNGEKIKIWEDRWIPTHSSHKIQDPVRLLSREAKVAEIINENINWWNITLIEQIFPQETVEKICSLSICPRSQEDRLVWAGTKLGTFSVRSAYHLEMERRSRVVGCSTMASLSSPFWQRLWKIKIPRSVMLFLWRACNEVLQTKSNLYKRMVVSVPDCPMCGIEAETTGHALWWCDAAQVIWGICGGSINKSVVVKEDFF